MNNYMTINKEEAIKYFEKENKKCDEFFSKTNLKKEIFVEIKNRFTDEDSAPIYRDGIGYFIRTKQELQYPQLYRIVDEKEELILDHNSLAEKNKPLIVAYNQVSNDHKYLAYAYNTSGEDSFNLVIKEIDTNKKILEIENVGAGFTWHGREFFFTRNDYKYRSYQVYKSNLQKEEELIFQEDNESAIVDVEESADRSCVFIYSVTKSSTQINIYKDKQLTEYTKRIEEREEYIEVNGDDTYLLTNRYNSEFSILKNGEEIIKPEKGKIETMIMTKNYLILVEQYEIKHIKIVELSTLKSYFLNFEEDTYALDSLISPQFENNSIRIGYETLIQPPIYYDYNLETKKWMFIKQSYVPNHNKDNYKQDFFYIEGVPVSICYKEGADKLWLLGYGAYGMSMDPYFSKPRISLLDRGFAFAIAHIRGGGELGEKWYKDGKLLNKKNTFIDYLNVARYFKNKEYKIIANGGSAGGMVIGYVLNEEPEIFTSAIADVPFVDVLTTMLDESIPLTTEEFEEWGNPKEKKYYDYIKSYSPVDNVRDKNYPPLYIQSGLNDTRVGYQEPLKWHKELSKYTQNTLLLRCDLTSGHAGKTARDDKIEEISEKYTFAILSTQ